MKVFIYKWQKEEIHSQMRKQAETLSVKTVKKTHSESIYKLNWCSKIAKTHFKNP